jgi:putative transposase
LDFLSDILLSDERKVRLLNVLDGCSRKVLLSFAASSINARKLVKLLKELIVQKGKPAYLRCDNGPEFISKVLAKFTEENGIEIRFSQPVRPTQNGLVERLNGTQRKECLNMKYFKTLQEVKIVTSCGNKAHYKSFYLLHFINSIIRLTFGEAVCPFNWLIKL